MQKYYRLQIGCLENRSANRTEYQQWPKIICLCASLVRMDLSLAHTSLRLALTDKHLIRLKICVPTNTFIHFCSDIGIHPSKQLPHLFMMVTSQANPRNDSPGCVSILFQGCHALIKTKFPVFSLCLPCALVIFPVFFYR